jgi:pimeloyl-ACP methyl ester carboxylesterase
MRPETKYTRSGDVHIAYQVVGEGPIDLVVVPGFVSHVEYIWEEPRAADFLRRLASFSRVIMFDKRGTGLSGLPNFALKADGAHGVRRRLTLRSAGKHTRLGVVDVGPKSL